MIIHTVKQGESVYTIARNYKVTPESIIINNELVNPAQLSVGQSLVILRTAAIHTVRSGETIYILSRRYNVPMSEILSANPQLGTGSMISPGDRIIIPQASPFKTQLEVNGYAYPTINREVLLKTLPSLTYLSIFSYDPNEDGSLNPINDTPLITLARQNGVAPIMVVSNIIEDQGFSSQLAHTLLTNQAVQNNLISNILSTLRTKNYYGVNLDFEYIFPYDRESYNNFTRRLSALVRSEGFVIMISLAPKISASQPGLLYEAHDYPVQGALVDRVILMTYEWGYIAGPPLPVAPLNEVQRVLNYAITAIPRNKILMGIPNYGYDWTLPFERGTLAQTLTNVGAVNRAFEVKAEIRFDPTAQSPFYTYYDSQGREHIVWFEDARSIQSKLNVVKQYGLQGVSYWTINSFFPQNWLVLNYMFDVVKLI